MAVRNRGNVIKPKPPVVVPRPNPIRPGGVNLALAAAIPASASERRSDLPSLHPLMREATTRVLAQCTADGIPFQAFETFRSPRRQQWLFDQGRSRPGPIVTKAQPWSSYHQYGLAVDFVLLIGGKWSWDTSGPRAAWWKRLHEIGRAAGLEPLSFELPHLQVKGLTIDALRQGKLPAGGDDPWAANLEAAIVDWTLEPSPPPVLSMRPALK